MFLQPLCVRRLAQQLLLSALAASPCNVDAAVCTAAVSAATAAGASIWPTQQTHPIVSRSIGFADSGHFKYPLNGLKMEVFLDIFALDCNRALRDLFARYIVPYAAAGNLPQLCHCCSCYICAGAKVALAASWSPLGQDAGVAKFEIWWSPDGKGLLFHPRHVLIRLEGYVRLLLSNMFNAFPFPTHLFNIWRILKEQVIMMMWRVQDHNVLARQRRNMLSSPALHCKMWRFQRLRRVAWKHFFRVILQMFIDVSVSSLTWQTWHNRPKWPGRKESTLPSLNLVVLPWLESHCYFDFIYFDVSCAGIPIGSSAEAFLFKCQTFLLTQQMRHTYPAPVGFRLDITNTQ